MRIKWIKSNENWNSCPLCLLCSCGPVTAINLNTSLVLLKFRNCKGIRSGIVKNWNACKMLSSKVHYQLDNSRQFPIVKWFLVKKFILWWNQLINKQKFAKRQFFYAFILKPPTGLLLYSKTRFFNSKIFEVQKINNSFSLRLPFMIAH